MADGGYRFNNLNNCDLQTIFSAFGIKIPADIYQLGQLKHIKQTIENFQGSAEM